MASIQHKASTAADPVEAPAPPDKATARRLKKREQDRKAQRVARERKNNRIAYLEALVDQLTHDNADSEVPLLMDRLSRVTREKDGLVDILRSLESTIRRHIEHVADDDKPLLPTAPPSLPVDTSRDDDSSRSRSASLAGGRIAKPPSQPAGPSSIAWDAEPHHLPSESAAITPASAPAAWDHHPASAAFELPFDSFSYVGEMPSHDPPHLNRSDSSPNSSTVDDDVIVPLPPTADCPCLLGSRHVPGHRGGPGINTWRAANEALGKAPTPLTPDAAAAEEATSHDTPIRVVLEGWDNAEAAGILTESWRKLRLVDEVCFKNCGDIERLAILKTMHLLMTYHGDPTPHRLSGLPRWFWMR